MANPKSFPEALNEQIANEFGASMQYIGTAVYYDVETLPRLAAFFYRQAAEEREHAMLMVQYLLDVDEEVRIPDIESK
jgi:ferritin